MKTGSVSEQKYLKDWIYGGIDGTVTTFAVISSVVGASLPTTTIIIVGLANVFADGFSMATANYVSTNAEVDQYKDFLSKTFKASHEAVRCKVNDPARSDLCGNEKEQDVVSNMENQFKTLIRSPLNAAISTFAAFILCGSIPLLPYVAFFPAGWQFLWSCILTGFVFFFIGSIKSKWTHYKWWYSGFLTLSIGSLASFMAYWIGYALKLYISVPVV